MIDMKVSLGIQDAEILNRLFSIINGYFWNRDILYDDFHVFLSWAKMDDLCKILDLIVYRDTRNTLSMENMGKMEKVEKREKSWGECLYNELINVFRI
jgi:hypothetical protein